MTNSFGKKSIIPVTDVSINNPAPYLRKITKLLKTGNYILGQEVIKFEQQFASYLGVKYCVGVASGTDAILLALKALGIKEGDEVIVPAFTFISSATPLLMLGAKPIFVDVREDLPVIDEKKIEEAITKKTRAIIVVHLYGYSCEMDKISEIAKKHKLSLIEDVAQAHGTVYKGRKLGSFGDISAFSFYPTKNLGAFGDAGAVVTSNKKLYKEILLLRDHGQAQKYKHEIVGYNSRLDALQASILQVKLESLDTVNNKKTNIAKLYNKKLEVLPLKFFPLEFTNDSKPALYLYVIRTKYRNHLLEFLKNKGITTMIHYPVSLSNEKIFNLKIQKRDFPNANNYASSVLSIPFFAGITKKQVEFVSDAIAEFFTNAIK